MKTAPRPCHAWPGTAGTTSSPNSNSTSKTHADLFMIASLNALDWSRNQDTTRDNALRLSGRTVSPWAARSWKARVKSLCTGGKELGSEGGAAEGGPRRAAREGDPTDQGLGRRVRVVRIDGNGDRARILGVFAERLPVILVDVSPLGHPSAELLGPRSNDDEHDVAGLAASFHRARGQARVPRVPN